MSNLQAVFQKWRAHVKNDIHRKPGMTFSQGSAPVKKLSSLYLIGDLTGATECYLTGHGGSFDADYLLTNKSLTVPAGVTVNFYQPDGYILGFGTKALRTGPPVKHGGTTDQLYTGGSQCPNYILTKDQGRHLSGDTAYAADWEMDYTSSQAVASDLNIVLVTIRNRWFNAGVNLESAIKDVRSAAKSITKFNCLFCRVRDGHTADSWDAVNGAWT